eukprot:1403467-Pyramimonas_sp.AAC.1
MRDSESGATPSFERREISPARQPALRLSAVEPRSVRTAPPGRTGESKPVGRPDLHGALFASQDR